MKGFVLKESFNGFWEEYGKELQVVIPEHRLILGIIIRAMLDYINPGFCGRRNRNQMKSMVRMFLFEEGNDEEEWSLMWLLGHISNDPAGIRKKIQVFVIDNEGSSLSALRVYTNRVCVNRKHPKFFRIK